MGGPFSTGRSIGNRPAFLKRADIAILEAQDEQELRKSLDSQKRVMAERPSVLPQNLPPRLLSREQAAAYMGISVSLLDRLIEDELAPKGIQLRGRVVWDRKRLDEYIDRLSHGVTFGEPADEELEFSV